MLDIERLYKLRKTQIALARAYKLEIGEWEARAPEIVACEASANGSSTDMPEGTSYRITPEAKENARIITIQCIGPNKNEFRQVRLPADIFAADDYKQLALEYFRKHPAVDDSQPEGVKWFDPETDVLETVSKARFPAVNRIVDFGQEIYNIALSNIVKYRYPELYRLVKARAESGDGDTRCLLSDRGFQEYLAFKRGTGAGTEVVS